MRGLAVPQRAAAAISAWRMQRTSCSPPSSAVAIATGAGIDRVRAAVAEVAAADLRRSGDGTMPGIVPRRSPRRVRRAPECRRAGRAYRDARARRRWPRPGPSRRPRPHTSPRPASAMRATTPRSCVISTRPMPNSRCSSASRCRICAWMVTSSAVVGSSAMISDGLAHQRHGDHHALAQAARELVRILPEPARRRRNADALEQVHRALARLAPRACGGGAAAPPRAGCRWCRRD